MAIKNVDVGVARALKASKVEKGMSEAAADAWAASNQAAGLAQFNASLAGKPRPSEKDIWEAFQALKVWAQT